MQTSEFIFVQIDYKPYFIGLFFILISLAIFIYSFKKNPKDNTQKIAKQNLKKLNFSNSPKEIAYSFCENAQAILNEKNKKLYFEIANELETFKYKKITDESLGQELKTKIKKFIEDFA